MHRVQPACRTITTLSVLLVAPVVALTPLSASADCCQNQIGIDLHNTGCDFEWAACNVACADECCFGFCPNSNSCNNCTNSCDSDRDDCRDNAPDCVECQDFNENCEIISTWPLGPGKCKDDLECYFMGLTESRCGPPRNDSNIYDQNLCALLFEPGVCFAQMAANDPQTLTFGTGVGAACLADAAVVEVGTVYGRDGSYGCYRTSCTGFQFDCSVSVAMTLGFLDQDFADLAGTDFQSCVEGGTPIVNLSVGICEVFQDVDNCTECCNAAQVEEVTDECEIVGFVDSVSFGLGFSPVTITFLECETQTIKVGDMTPLCDIDVITGNQTPTCDAGGPYLQQCNGTSSTTLMLDGTGSSDGDGTPLTYNWSLGDCAAKNGSLDDNTSAQPMLTLDTSCCDNCTVSLTVSDGSASATCSASVAVVDTMAPSLSAMAADQTIECDIATNMGQFTNWLSTQGGAAASDTCGDVTWSNDFSALSDECGATGDATVTFTAADACDLADTDCSDDCSQTTASFTIEDTTPPSITCPANITIPCPADFTPANTGMATCSDMCGDCGVDFEDAGTQGCGNAEVVTRTWTATDECGLTSSCEQVIYTDRDGDGVADVFDACPDNGARVCDGPCTCEYEGPVAAPPPVQGEADELEAFCGMFGPIDYDIDTDGDGTLDCHDHCPFDFLKVQPGICGCQWPDVDTDGDGTFDCPCFQATESCTPGTDDCGPGQCVECAPAGDDAGFGASCEAGAFVCVVEGVCGDYCPTDPDSLIPGVCGCHTVQDADSDGDGVLDCEDDCPLDTHKIAPGTCGCGLDDAIDNDGDGTPDCIDGCPDDPASTAPGPCGCGEPDATYTVGGVVHVPGDLLDGIPYVNVQLFCDNHPFNETTDTCVVDPVDGTGKFEFDNVPCGPCHLRFAYHTACDDTFEAQVCGTTQAVGNGQSVDIVVNSANGGGPAHCLQSIAVSATNGKFDILGRNELCRLGQGPCFDDALPPLVEVLPPLADCFFNGGPDCCPASDLGGECFCRLDCNSDGIFSLVSDLWCWAGCVVQGLCHPDHCGDAPLPPGVAPQGLPGHTVGGIVYSAADNPLFSGVQGIRVDVIDAEGSIFTATTNRIGLWVVQGLDAGRHVVEFDGGKGMHVIEVHADHVSKNQSIRWQVDTPRRIRPQGRARTR